MCYGTRQTDIVLGTDLANRGSVQTEALIGFFVNLLPMRTDLSGEPSFAELVRRVREIALGAYAHQDVPFDKLVEELQPQRSLSHSPLVQVLFVQQNTPRGAVEMPGIELLPFKLDLSSKFDMAVFVSETAAGIAINWVYNPDLFDAATISRMLTLYRTILETVTANEEVRLSGLLDSLAEAEKQLRAAENREFQQASLQKLKRIKRKAVEV
jgi:non-ribosomal peptide synthetase component F